jgi:hypothetical protein
MKLGRIRLAARCLVRSTFGRKGRWVSGVLALLVIALLFRSRLPSIREVAPRILIGLIGLGVLFGLACLTFVVLLPTALVRPDRGLTKEQLLKARSDIRTAGAQIWSWIGLTTIGAVILVGLPIVFFVLPHTLVQTCRATDQPTALSGRCLTAEQRLKAESDVRTAGVQALGGLVVLLGGALGGYFTWQQVRLGREQLQANVQATSQQAEHARKQLEQALEATRQQGELTRQQLEQSLDATRQEQELVRQGQITERFTRAIDQLGNEKLDIRLGGIYALERIAHESKEHHGPIMEILTTYMREHSPWPPSRPGQYVETAPLDDVPPLSTRAADIQAVVTVLGRRERHHETSDTSLSLGGGLDLRKADVSDAHLEGAFLQGAHLEGANFLRAHLEGAFLWRAHLEGAVLTEAHLERAFLQGAHLEAAFVAAAYVEEAILTDAHLEGAHLNVALKLTQQQVDSAFTDDATKLPSGLHPSLRKPPSEVGTEEPRAG